MRLRTRLFQLVAGAVVPLVLLAIALGVSLATEQQETFREGALARSRALMTAVDAELRGHFRAVEALGASGNLAAGDPQAFYAEADRVLESQPDWQNVILARADGLQLVNLAVPLGSLPVTLPDIDGVEDVTRTLQPVVGNVYFGTNTQKYGVPVRVPIFGEDANVKYVLTAVIDPGAFAKLLQAQDLPATWFTGLVDATGHFVGRVPAVSHESLASESFLEAVRGAREGWFRGRTLEGIDAYTAFSVSAASGWSAGIAIPASEVNAGARSAAWIIVLGTLASVAIALGFAFVHGRSIARPIAQLAASARSLGQGLPVTNPPSYAGIREVREVASALSEAAEAVRERHGLLEREQAALRESDRAKDAFLAMLGHELRNPLGAITTAVQVLKGTAPGTDMAAQSQSIIERQTRHMTRLIEDLLDVSRVTMGKVTLKRETFNLASFAERVVRTWERSDRARAGRVVLDAAEVWVNADRARAEQVLANLLDNAAKFSPADRPIRVRVRKEDGTAVLEVADEGEGIPQDQLDRVFGLFVQGPAGPARLRGGMGVGLALVKRLVEMHGGTVEAESDGLGKGATFAVRLPAAKALPSTEADDEPSTRLRALRMLRVLVTEDNDDARLMMQSMLALDGHEVRVARDGAGTLACLQSWIPDVILMDIGLPDMDGYEIARQIAETYMRGKPKLIALTGYGQADDERRAYDAGFDLHLTKPVEPDELREVLAALIRGRTDRDP